MICPKTHTQLPLDAKVESGPRQPKKQPLEKTAGLVAGPRKLTQKRELAGCVFGRWTVLYQGPHIGAHIGWICRCKCGVVKNVMVGNLTFGKSVSCGCFKDEVAHARMTTHGATIGGPTKEYELWMAMKRRCYGINTIGWNNYGGRGIKVCRRWKGSFKNFLKDMGPRPSPKHSVERRDNDGNYTPSNCYWATKREQSYNKRNTLFATYNQETKTVMEWSEQFGTGYEMLYARLRRKWSIEKALLTPKMRNYERMAL